MGKTMLIFQNEALLQALFWSILTIGIYLIGKKLYHHTPSWWASPLVVAPLLLILIALTLHVSYGDYIRGTHWLVVLLAPATVAFAVPIYEKRVLIRQNWRLLMIGVVVGNITAVVSSWELANLFGLNNSIRLSLLPRSISTPFALIVSDDIGGVPGMTAIFVVITGVIGAAIGEGLLNVLPFRSVFAQGALFGMGAHGAGTAKAHLIDSEIGTIAGLVMVLSGLLNVLIAPLLIQLLK
jgi:predicted murein hydrolase (TIGR00659 family)